MRAGPAALSLILLSCAWSPAQGVPVPPGLEAITPSTSPSPGSLSLASASLHRAVPHVVARLHALLALTPDAGRLRADLPSGPVFVPASRCDAAGHVSWSWSQWVSDAGIPGTVPPALAPLPRQARRVDPFSALGATPSVPHPVHPDRLPDLSWEPEDRWPGSRGFATDRLRWSCPVRYDATPLLRLGLWDRPAVRVSPKAPPPALEPARVRWPW